MTVIVAYAPTDISDEETKDAYYEQLQSTVGSAPPHDIVIVLSDANAMLSLDTRDPSLGQSSGLCSSTPLPTTTAID